MVIFDKGKHTYKNPETGEYYISVSQLLSKYKPKFDADKMAGFVAKKRKTTKDVILKEWAAGNKLACDKGQGFHDAVENYLKNDVVDGVVVPELLKVFHKDDYKKVWSERILWHDELKVAGMSDCVCDVDANTFDILDIKTNKAFNFFSKYGEYLKHPLAHLQYCQHNDYALQLSLYAYLYAIESGKKLRKLEILYWNDEKFTIIPSNYLFWDVQVLLKHWKA